MNYVALIPLRAGSKGIPGKNIRPLAGKPLCRWSIEAAARASKIDAVYVATDSEEIREAVRGFGLPKVIVIDRGAETATDSASTESVMLEFASRYPDFKKLVLMQATSPLTRTEDVEGAISLFESSGADSLLTVVPQTRFLWNVFEDGTATATNYDPLKRPLRQWFSPHHVENGAIYVCEANGLREHKNRLFGKIAAYSMPEETYIELDEPADWLLIEGLLHNRLRAEQSLPGDIFAEKAPDIRLFLTDVDGVLTDAGMYYTEAGDELKKFNTRDGMGLALLRKVGVLTGIVTSENTSLVERRATKLNLDILRQGVRDKAVVLAELLKELQLEPSQVAYIGDDLNDLGIIQNVGLSASPADAAAEIIQYADYICQRRGGEGCVREFVEKILAAREPGRPVETVTTESTAV